MYRTVKEIAAAWKEDKRLYVKRSTMAAYVLIYNGGLCVDFGEPRSSLFWRE